MLIQLLLISAFSLAIFNLWRRERSGQISRLGAVLWSLVWFGATVVVALPETASWFASTVGVGRGADAVTYVAVALLYYLVFRLFVSQRKMEADVTKLVKELALRGLPERDNDGTNAKSDD